MFSVTGTTANNLNSKELYGDHTMYRRVFIIILSALVLSAALVSCSGSELDPGTPDTKAPNSGDPVTGEDTSNLTSASDLKRDIEIDEDLAALDYAGKTVTVLARDNSDSWAAKEIWVEELTNDPVNDAIFNRNAFVCETLGLSGIKMVAADGYEEIQEKVNVMVSSGDTTYDIVAGSVAYGTPMINSGLMYNLFSNGIDTYLDTSNPWWAQYWLEQAEMGDRLYCITGASALSLTRLMFVMYYNKDLGESLGVEDMYKVVEEGGWTIDYLNEVIAPLYLSLNGDDEKDIEDRYGLAINHYENCDMFWSAFDMTMISKDEDGWFEMNTSSKEKIANAFEKVYYLIRENPGTYDTIDTGGFDVASGMFSSGTVLFAALHLKYAESKQFRNMQNEYGILPIPKYDEDQKDYFTYSHDQYTVFMVPITVADPEMSGAVLEAMAFASYRDVQPVYYDLVLKGRYANDPESRAMLDIITTNIKVDPAWIYGRQLDLPAAKVFRSLIYGGEKTFASAYAKVERTLPVFLKNLRKTVSALDY